ncbi:MAG: site-2 protease family protein [Nitrososphaerales archaeon]
MSDEEKKIEEEAKTVSFQFPFILLRTRRGLNLMDRLATLRLTERLGWVALYLFPLVGAVGFSLILFSASVMLSSAPIREFVRESGPFVHILIPGLNPYVPLIYGWIALIVAMIVHEGSHGVLARSFKLRVKSSGLIFFFVLPIGAFVDIDEEEIKKTVARKTGRVMAAGPMSNFVVALASLVCLMLVVGSMVPASNGIGVVGVYQDWPAHNVGIAPADTVLAINGVDVSSSDDVKRVLSDFRPGDTVSVKFLHEGGEVERRLVLAASDNSSRPIMGFEGIDSTAVSDILENYRRPRITSPLIYLFIPTFTMAQWRVPFSDTMHNFYTSPLGDATYLVANILFWMWFVNFNLAIFNALPLYPLDGGQALRSALQAYGSNRGWQENTAKRLVTAVSLLIVALLVSVIVGPYILG